VLDCEGVSGGESLVDLEEHLLLSGSCSVFPALGCAAMSKSFVLGCWCLEEYEKGAGGCHR